MFLYYIWLVMALSILSIDGNYFFFPWELIYTGDDSVENEAYPVVNNSNFFHKCQLKKPLFC